MSKTLFIGKVYQHFDKLPSTNDYAVELLAKSRPAEGMVIRTDKQTAGRGQFGSRWESADGQNLTLSFVLYPVWLAVTDQFRLSMAVALALYDTVKALDTPLPVSLKWPNDLYLGAQKVAGVLIQNSIAGQTLQSSVVGIGLNVNQLEFQSDARNPTSLALALGRALDLDALMFSLFECVERRYLQLKSGGHAAIRAEYAAHLYRRGIESDFQKPGGPAFRGILLGVTEAGRLRILTEAGEETFEVKEVRYV
jgi:BirA family transcriptional regulator, biotin operon repressor / biotin---[acetyl-CoA-carboxylase] ligase